jgi:hypothetical protein
VRLEGLGKLQKLICLIGPRSHDLSSCGIVPQPSTLLQWKELCAKSEEGKAERFNILRKALTKTLLPVMKRLCFCVSLPWEPPTGYPNLYPSNSPINRITMETNNRNNTGIVMSGFYIGSASRQQKYTWNPLQPFS